MRIGWAEEMGCPVNCIDFPTSFPPLSPNFKIELLSLVLLSFSELLVQLEIQNAIEMCFLVRLRFNWVSGMLNVKLTIRPLLTISQGENILIILGPVLLTHSNLTAKSVVSVTSEPYRQRHGNKCLFVILKVITQLFFAVFSSAQSHFRNSFSFTVCTCFFTTSFISVTCFCWKPTNICIGKPQF